jgi:hypothetical protein
LLDRDGVRRGHNETPGTWRHGSPADDVLDLAIVVEFLKKNYGYLGKHVAGFVNVAGRYRMRVSLYCLIACASFIPPRFISTNRKSTVNNFLPVDMSSNNQHRPY